MVPPSSDRILRVPPYSRTATGLPVRAYHPLRGAFPDASGSPNRGHWPDPISLATTQGVSVDFFSSGYLDVSVPRVRAAVPMGSARGDPIRAGFPHSDIHGSQLARSSPWLFAACHVLHRLSVPRHPPGAFETLDPPTAHRDKPHATGASQPHHRTRSHAAHRTPQGPAYTRESRARFSSRSTMSKITRRHRRRPSRRSGPQAPRHVLSPQRAVRPASTRSPGPRSRQPQAA